MAEVQCDHPTIAPTDQGWACTSCQVAFYPQYHLDELLKRVDEENDAMVDMVVAMSSDILYRVHRAIVTGADPSEVQGSEEPAVAVCEQKGHAERDDQGACTRCGHNPYLGG